MDIAKFRLRITAVIAAIMLTSAASSAEAPPRGLPPAAERQPAVLGLSNPALNLSDSQKARLDEIMKSYVAGEKALFNQYSAPEAKHGAEAALASKQARERMTAAVDQVLNESQRKVLKTEQAEHAARAAQAAKAAAATRGVPPTMDPPQGR
jgi:hypothetical protein